MKYIIVIGDGMAGFPLEELGGKTPLQVADKPNMDWIASNGSSGMLKNIPGGMRPNSDVAIMSILGYDPKKYYTGRGPLEAAGMDVEMKDKDVAFRCNLITLEDGLIGDYSAGHVTTEEAADLMEAIKKRYGEIGDFYVGVGYRHLFVLRDSNEEVNALESTPPHDIVGESLEDHLIEPSSLEIVETLNEMILSSREVLSDHPVNEKREEAGENPANSIWLWGQGKKPSLEPIEGRYGISGGVISAVTLVGGLGVSVGMEKIDVPGATGYYDTSYENKAEWGLKALETHDFVLIHVEAPDEAGHSGNVEKKIEAIEKLDQSLIGRILNGMDEDYTFVVTADHMTPVQVGTHVSDPVPFTVFSSEGEKDDLKSFDELSAGRGSWGTLRGHELMDKIVRN